MSFFCLGGFGWRCFSDDDSFLFYTSTTIKFTARCFVITGCGPSFPPSPSSKHSSRRFERSGWCTVVTWEKNIQELREVLFIGWIILSDGNMKTMILLKKQSNHICFHSIVSENDKWLLLKHGLDVYIVIWLTEGIISVSFCMSRWIRNMNISNLSRLIGWEWGE